MEQRASKRRGGGERKKNEREIFERRLIMYVLYQYSTVHIYDGDVGCGMYLK